MLDAFIATVKTLGLARTNRFQVYISFPNGAGFFGTSVLSSLFCEVAGLPGMNIASQPHRVFGESREVPYEPMYDPLSFTFHMDSTFVIKDAFESWMYYIFDPIKRTSGYYKHYVSNIDIVVENVNGIPPHMVTLYEAYPKSIHTINLDNNSKDTMRLVVDWSYKYWRSRSLVKGFAGQESPAILMR